MCCSLKSILNAKTGLGMLMGLLIWTVFTAHHAKAAVRQSSVPDEQKLAFFEKEVRPLLIGKCFQCHSGKTPKGSLRLDRRDGLTSGGSRGPAIELDEPQESLLIQAVQRHPDAPVQMPPDETLSEQEIAILIRWISDGAVWPEVGSKELADSDTPQQLWSLSPLEKPEVPEASNHPWISNPVDHFVLDQLRRLDLTPASPLSKIKLIRRATFDLIGLPPSPDEVTAFLKDESDEAFARVIDRLLTSPRYGERWGRHWLDVARYADSNGMDENLTYANAWRYRDWVIQAFNEDKPYDQFVREQIAGDLLPVDDEQETIQRRIATAFLALGPKMLAEDDPIKMQMDIIDEQMETVGRTFMGMSIGCARCHSHKFDPITHEDYYALAGIFKSTKTMENFKVVAAWYEHQVAPQAQINTRKEYDEKHSELQSVIADVIAKGTETFLHEQRLRAADYLLHGANLIHYQRFLEDIQKRYQLMDGDLANFNNVMEAEHFKNGNVAKNQDSYGEGIGVILTSGSGFAEYDVSVENAGNYQLHFRYAAAESRPIDIYVDSNLVRRGALEKSTGSWNPDGQKWFFVTTLSLDAGKHTLRIQRDGVFPHIDKFALVPWPEGQEQLPLITRSLAQVASEEGLVASLLDQWREYLEKTASEENSPLTAWHRLESTFAPEKEINGQNVNKPTTQLLNRFLMEKRIEFAQQYGELFQLALDEPTDATEHLKPLRMLLLDKEGPFRDPGDTESFFNMEIQKELKDNRDKLVVLTTDAPPELPLSMGVKEGVPENVKIHLRGSHLTLGKVVLRGTPASLSPEPTVIHDTQQSGRLELAQWLTSKKHPLTARVMVNRIWRGHFGEGLVRTPDNFGKTGEAPSNPDLLDWLAIKFMDLDWSVKRLHRLIMLSSTYQMSSESDPKAMAIDPDNRNFWRMNRRRLEAEAVRDSVLAVSGQLDLSPGGTMLPLKNREYVTSSGTRITNEYESPRRAVYLPVIRSALYQQFVTFDFADPSMANGARSTSIVAPQALFMLNSSFVAQQSEAMAARLLKRHDLTDRMRIDHAYQIALSRPAMDSEIEEALHFVRNYQDAVSKPEKESSQRLAWRAFCRVLIASNEFIHVE